MIISLSTLTYTFIVIYFSEDSIRQRFLIKKLKNNEKLPSLSLPLNLNLNYENFVCFRGKGTTFFQMYKKNDKKNAFFNFYK